MIKGGSILTDAPAFVMPYFLVRLAALLSTRRILLVLVLKERLYLQEQDAGKGLYRSCWRFALRISARTAPSFMLNMP